MQLFEMEVYNIIIALDWHPITISLKIKLPILPLIIKVLKTYFKIKELDMSCIGFLVGILLFLKSVSKK